MILMTTMCKDMLPHMMNTLALQNGRLLGMQHCRPYPGRLWLICPGVELLLMGSQVPRTCGELTCTIPFILVEGCAVHKN